MEKSITIKTSEKGEVSFEISGYNEFEALGLLRFYEKQVWLKMTSNAGKKEKEAEQEDAVIITGISSQDLPN